jgi:hypothetical protein
MATLQEKKQLHEAIEKLQGKINFIKSCNLSELKPEHREKVLNCVQVLDMIIDLILEKK